MIRSHRAIRLLVSFVGGRAVLAGAIGVLVVTLALGELGLGAGGPGYLTAAFGAGGLVGAALGLSLVGRRRLVPHFGAAALGCGVALVVLGLWPTAAAAFLLLGAAGAGTIVFDVTAQMLLQRTAPTEVLSRVFGVAEGFTNLGWAVGSLAVPALDALGGVRTTLIAIGALLPIMVLLRLRALISVDAAADVYIMKTPEAARKVFESEASPASQPLTLGDRARISKGSLLFTRGRFYVKLVAFEEAPEVAEGLKKLGEAIERK